MAQKSGVGGWFWLLLGVLLGVALTLAALLFLSSGSGDGADRVSVADDAARAAAVIEPAPAPAPTPAVAPPAVEPALRANPTPRLNTGIDPVSDDQIADDAAAAGMTSRTPPAKPRGE
ncbi:MAG: hypothetical protein Q8L66_07195 [Caulobacter sp.]|nr:hypothetical protein [Caulobacter sp.]